MRDELEHLLDDDEDMAEMYLTDKLAQQQLDNSSTSSMNDRDNMDDEVLRAEMDDKYIIIYNYSFDISSPLFSCLH